MSSKDAGAAERRPRFVRVAERQGWDVEFVEEGRMLNFATLDDAMRAAQDSGPEWIEVGEVTPAAGGTPQHHRWRTLRRGPDGRYLPSGIAWGGPARR